MSAFTSHKAILPFLLASAGIAGPITTVPWNGHTGAVSFTYDDARNSQIPNLLPQLDGLGIKATFFITNMYSFPSKSSEWIEVAKKGHELANHTSNHNTPTSDNVRTMATTLRGLNPVVEALTLAYPNCTVSGTSAVEAENFMARGCGQTTYAWNKQPSDWMNIQGLILGPSSAGNGVTMMNTAKNNNAWVTTIVHDVANSPDQYSLTPADNKKMLDQAVANKLWIATYQDVGAYYRAHFTMDNVNASAGNGPWDLKWTSPHPKMPRKVLLKVKLDANTFGAANSIKVMQNNQEITPESDGSYTIDFMLLGMKVTKVPVGVARERSRLEGFQVRRDGRGFDVEGPDAARIDAWTLSGKHLGATDLSEGGKARLDVEASSSVLLVATRAGGARSSQVVGPVH